jgi:hypothetical protein
MRLVLDSVWFTFLYPIFLIGFLVLGNFYSRRFYHEGGLLGIFALLISFTMVVSGNFVRARADNIHAEAEELSLIFRTSKFYDDTLRNHVHNYLRDFLRIQLDHRNPSVRDYQLIIDDIEKIEEKLDEFLVRYSNKNPGATADIKT